MERLVLFAKAPRLNAVKTRLQPPLTASEALALHAAMLADQVAFARYVCGPVRSFELCLDGPLDAREAEALTVAGGAITEQGDGDLGVRLHRALVRAFDAGVSRALILGADAPTLPARLVEDAFARLRDGADAVIVPAQDGGYVLVGASRPVPRLFEGVSWGTATVAADTRRMAQGAGYALAETAAWADVDDAGDLSRLADELAADPGRAPATAAILASFGFCTPRKPML